MPHARSVGKATIRAIRRDKAELVIVPGPGRVLKALWELFPGLGPAMNRLAGVEEVMERIALAREQQREQGMPGSPTA
jgi:hypothetical protein